MTDDLTKKRDELAEEYCRRLVPQDGHMRQREFKAGFDACYAEMKAEMKAQIETLRNHYEKHISGDCDKELASAKQEIERLKGTANGFAEGMFTAAQDTSDVHELLDAERARANENGERAEYWKSRFLAERQRSSALVKALEFYENHWGTNNQEIKSQGYKIAENARVVYEKAANYEQSASVLGMKVISSDAVAPDEVKVVSADGKQMVTIKNSASEEKGAT